MASAMPVLPEVESMMTLPGRSRPHWMPSWIMRSAGRSFTEPPGLKPSSFANIRTPGATPSRTHRISTSGVLPISWSVEGTTSGPSAGDVGGVGAAGAGSMGAKPALPASGDGRDDGDLVPRLERRVEVAEKADVLAVHEDVHEAPHLPALVADALLDARMAPLEIVDQRAHRRPLGVHPSGPAGVLAERGRDLDLHHDDRSSPLLPA